MAVAFTLMLSIQFYDRLVIYLSLYHYRNWKSCKILNKKQELRVTSEGVVTISFP
jgi:hypothetical protein